MKKSRVFIAIPVAILLLLLVFYTIRKMNAVTVYAPAQYSDETLVIDAGHGGEDGGAVSVTGALEKDINLAIAQRLDDICGLYGIQTKMTRTDDRSIHDGDAVTIREKKVSDLHNRVAMIEGTKNATVISIHQNIYSSSVYSGAQAFYANGELSSSFAKLTQDNLRLNLAPNNSREAKPIPKTVYLMNHISCRAILVECGFLSNMNEDALLQTSQYQTKLAAVLAGSYLQYHSTEVITR
jgi:N-acetylmuramoyl-L-alanine amidase